MLFTQPWKIPLVIMTVPTFPPHFPNKKHLLLSLLLPSTTTYLTTSSTSNQPSHSHSHSHSHSSSTNKNNSNSKKTTFSHIFQECSIQKCLNPGKQAHAHMISSGFTPTTFVTNCLIHMYVSCSCLDYAHKVFDRMPHKDVVSWNAMIAGCANAGLMGAAVSYFGAMPDRDVVSWNSLISGFLRNGQAFESLDVFLRMGWNGVCRDFTSFAVGLKACSALEDSCSGVQMHGLSIHMGLDLDVVTGSALVDMYAKCRLLDDALQLFHGMPNRNWVSWGAMIAGCIQNECLMDGLQLFIDMQHAGIGVSQSAYASILRACAQWSLLKLGRQVHAHALKRNFSSDTIVGTAVLDTYAKLRRIEDATKVFQSLPVRSLQSWNAMVVGLTRNNKCFEAVKLVQLLNGSGIGLDETSLSGAFSACAGSESYMEGLQIHVMSIKKNLDSNVSVANAALDMYGKCRALVEACRIFDEMDRRDVVSWNAMITAFEQNASYEDTVLYFDQMLHYGMEPDIFTFGSILKACGALLSLDRGMKIHDRIIKCGLGLDSFMGSALVDMYCKCGVMDEAQKIHDRIERRTTVSWNAMISGFSLQKRSEDSQKFFSKMLDMGLKPDNFTYAAVLDICANLSTVELGKQIHAQTIKQRLQGDVFISSTLIDMYSKCGNMQESLLIFEKMPERDYVSWNAMISGYAQHGLGVKAIEIFNRMRAEKFKPNHATFIAVLGACGYMGLFDEGLLYFHLMLSDYGLEPQLEHYSCMVDIIGRSGHVHEALKLIYDMPFEADAVIWRTLLSACQIHRNMEVAELAASSILQLEADDSAAYILLSNIYAESGQWAEVSKMRRMMREHKLKKEPGCSWIEVKNKVHTFLVGDEVHPRCSEIYEELALLINDMRWFGYVPEMDFFLIDDENGQVDKQEQLEVRNQQQL